MLTYSVAYAMQAKPEVAVLLLFAMAGDVLIAVLFMLAVIGYAEQRYKHSRQYDVPDGFMLIPSGLPGPTDTSVDETHFRLMERWREDNAARNAAAGWP